MQRKRQAADRLAATLDVNVHSAAALANATSSRRTSRRRRQQRLCGALLLSTAFVIQCERPTSTTGTPETALTDAPGRTSATRTPSVEATTADAPEKAATPQLPSEPRIELRAGGKHVAESKYGMVTSVEEHATRAGVAMLEAGGNAVDAAVAVAYALAVTHPSAGNIGGGGFMLIKFAGKDTMAIDFREQAPRALTQTGFDAMITNRAMEPRASGIPGSVAGLNLALDRFGRLERRKVLAPAISLARGGHALGKRQATVLGWAFPLLKRDRGALGVFARGKRPLQAGELLVQPKLANTLERIAEQGNAGFYSGTTAKVMSEYMSQHGGWITEEDLAQYAAKERKPLHLTYRGFDVDVMAPPSAGGVAVVQMLEMLEALKAYEYRPGSVEGLHLFAEVAKRAHAERRFHVVDPDSVPDYDANARRARWHDPQTWLGPFPIRTDRVTAASELHPLYAAAMKELDNTTHFSTADAAGNVVSCTTTLSGSFGAKYVIADLGLVMNNSVGAFGTVGDDVPKPGRRMTSSMSPTIVSRDGKAVLALGSPGGDTIPNTVVQVLRNLVDAQMPLDEAIDAPRIHHGFVPDAIRTERLRPLDERVRAGLAALGHQFDGTRLTIGDANDLLIQGGVAYGYADPREGGLALGPNQIDKELSPQSEQVKH